MLSLHRKYKKSVKKVLPKGKKRGNIRTVYVTNFDKNTKIKKNEKNVLTIRNEFVILYMHLKKERRK